MAFRNEGVWYSYSNIKEYQYYLTLLTGMKETVQIVKLLYQHGSDVTEQTLMPL
jgi:hypothetical protein